MRSSPLVEFQERMRAQGCGDVTLELQVDDLLDATVLDAHPVN